MRSMADTDRREHPRHFVQARARISDKRRGWEAQLLDLSHNGARLAVDACHHNLCEGDDVRLTIELDDIEQPYFQLPPGEAPHENLHLQGTLVYAEQRVMAIEYYPLSAVDQALLALLLARPED